MYFAQINAQYLIFYISDSSGCNIITDLAVHDIDTAVWLTSCERPLSVYAVTHTHDGTMQKIGQPDTVLLVLKFRNGIICSLDIDRDCAYGYDMRIEVCFLSLYRSVRNINSGWKLQSFKTNLCRYAIVFFYNHHTDDQEICFCVKQLNLSEDFFVKATHDQIVVVVTELNSYSVDTLNVRIHNFYTRSFLSVEPVLFINIQNMISVVINPKTHIKASFDSLQFESTKIISTTVIIGIHYIAL